MDCRSKASEQVVVVQAPTEVGCTGLGAVVRYEEQTNNDLQETSQQDLPSFPSTNLSCTLAHPALL